MLICSVAHASMIAGACSSKYQLGWQVTAEHRAHYAATPLPLPQPLLLLLLLLLLACC